MRSAGYHENMIERTYFTFCSLGRILTYESFSHANKVYDWTTLIKKVPTVLLIFIINMSRIYHLNKIKIVLFFLQN